jgi:hypothetical protein
MLFNYSIFQQLSVGAAITMNEMKTTGRASRFRNAFTVERRFAAEKSSTPIFVFLFGKKLKRGQKSSAPR